MMKRKLGILNSSTFHKSYGGIAPFIKNLDPFLQEAFDVTYMVLPDALYNIHFIPRRLIYLFYLLFNQRKLRDFDMILSHVPEGSIIVTYGKVPLGHIFHGNFNPMSQSRYWYGKYFKFIFSSMEKRIIEKAKLMYTVGNERPGIPKIFNPILHAVPVKNPDSRSGFIFSGRLEKIKNVDKIIRVYAKLKPEIQVEHSLYIAGMGTQENLLKDLAATLPIQGKVVFLGHLDNEALIEADSTKKIFLMASSQEGFPMAIAEAFSLGIPVISTDTGDISRFLTNNENGFLVPVSFTDQEYIQCIEAILNDYAKFSRGALNSAAIFRAEKVASDLINDINRVMR